MPKIERKVIVKCKQGLHARPAAMFVQIANKFDATIMVRKNDEEVNGKSIMGILMLGADHGCEVVLIADGNDAEATLSDLEGFLGKEE
ncbi:MAG: HPr family phosphocarrier protein [Candidatus Omnitrophica bacterium]|nr:HPr family phosphocarrier protein [Candidatus Omnitrophota bacterium]